MKLKSSKLLTVLGLSLILFFLLSLVITFDVMAKKDKKGSKKEKGGVPQIYLQLDKLTDSQKQKLEVVFAQKEKSKDELKEEAGKVLTIDQKKQLQDLEKQAGEKKKRSSKKGKKSKKGGGGGGEEE